MPGFGNPLSFVLGGGPSPQEQVYDAIYQAVGDGLRARPRSIVETWRMAKSRGLAAVMQDDRATMQAFPDKATDYLPVYEQILRIVPASDQSEQERRDVVTARYTRSIDATYPKLAAQLDTIDPLFQILTLPYTLTRTTDVGVRAFEDWDPSDPLASGPDYGGGREHTVIPNFSDDFVLAVFLDVGPGAFNVTNQRALELAKQELNESLPAWVDFRVFTALGFILDQDLLDVTAFGDGVYP